MTEAEEEEEEEAEEAEELSMRVAKVLEHVAFLLEPKLRTKMNQPPVRGGVELRHESHDSHAVSLIMWEEGVVRSNTTEARLIDRTTFHRVSHGNEKAERNLRKLRNHQRAPF